ncbi:MAG: hypothetical protein ABSA53_24620 [Streptosporangiaceae bacterium]|jgi:hypothetical protein
MLKATVIDFDAAAPVAVEEDAAGDDEELLQPASTAMEAPASKARPRRAPADLIEC